jgi:hypothetical protein
MTGHSVWDMAADLARITGFNIHPCQTLSEIEKETAEIFFAHHAKAVDIDALTSGIARPSGILVLYLRQDEPPRTVLYELSANASELFRMSERSGNSFGDFFGNLVL